MFLPTCPVSSWEGLIAEALHWANVDDDKSVSYRIFADPPGRRLVPEESLATVGAWDGSYLTLEPVREAVLRTTSSPLPDTISTGI